MKEITMTIPQNNPNRDKTNSSFHVLIIGAGIGGLCLAQGLKKAGVSVAIYERDRALDARLQGYRLNIEPVGSQALYECLSADLWEILVATSGDPGSIMGVFNEQFHELMQEDEHTNPTDPVHDTHAVSRVTLRRLLLAGLEEGVHFDKTFVRYEQTDDGKVTAFFADGSSASGDVLVGADGARSRVRQQLLPHARMLDPRAIGIGGKLALTEQSASWLPEPLMLNKNMFLPPRDFLFTSVFRRREPAQKVALRIGDHLQTTGLDSEQLLREVEDDDYVMWAFVAHRNTYPASVHGLRGQVLRDLVEQRMSNWHPDLRRLIASSTAETVEQFDFTAAVRVKPWPSTNVTLLGDAIHAMPPVGGMGGNTALRDASLLCRALAAVQRGEIELASAMHTYEAEMLKYGFAKVRETLLMLRMATIRSRIIRAITRTFFWLCGAVPLLRRAIFQDE
jgi:2-polyprenyl-6-methoxyphenol hydroxylase-like FAD-dependent oxidoreductase